MQNKVKTITRTTAVELINKSKGRFFTVTFTKKDKNMRTINCNKRKDSTTALGYIRVYSTQDKGYRSINPLTISKLVFNGVTYKVK